MLILAALSCALTATALAVSWPGTGELAFDETRWRSGASNELCLHQWFHAPTNRQRMVGDVLLHHVGPGLSKREVLARLGGADAKRDLDEVWLYVLGPERDLSSQESEWLYLRFDADERLASTWIDSW